MSRAVYEQFRVQVKQEILQKPDWIFRMGRYDG